MIKSVLIFQYLKRVQIRKTNLFFFNFFMFLYAFCGDNAMVYATCYSCKQIVCIKYQQSILHMISSHPSFFFLKHHWKYQHEAILVHESYSLNLLLSA